MRFTLALSLFLTAFSVHALTISQDVENEYIKQGGNTHALSHLKCFLQNYSQTDFDLREAGYSERCNGMDQEKRTVQLNRFDTVTIVDYTKGASERRLFILDLEDPKPPYVESFYTSHGRYQNTPYTNTTPGIGKNTIEWIDYYSNIKGSNATSSGFYITGHVYQGRWVGPQGDKYSLIVHGLNKDQNDNACDRAVVLHGNSFVKESGPDEGVKRMSSGCFMLDYDLVNHVIDRIRGGGGDHYKNEDRLGGTLLFTYGKVEAGQDSSLYCSSQSEDLLRIK